MLSGVGCVGVLSFSFSFLFFLNWDQLNSILCKLVGLLLACLVTDRKKEKAGKLTDLKITCANSCNPVAF